MQYASVSNVKYHIIMIMYFTTVSSTCLSAKKAAEQAAFLRYRVGNP